MSVVPGFSMKSFINFVEILIADSFNGTPGGSKRAARVIKE